MKQVVILILSLMIFLPFAMKYRLTNLIEHNKHMIISIHRVLGLIKNVKGIKFTSI